MSSPTSEVSSPSSKPTTPNPSGATLTVDASSPSPAGASTEEVRCRREKRAEEPQLFRAFDAFRFPSPAGPSSGPSVSAAPGVLPVGPSPQSVQGQGPLGGVMPAPSFFFGLGGNDEGVSPKSVSVPAPRPRPRPRPQARPQRRIILRSLRRRLLDARFGPPPAAAAAAVSTVRPDETRLVRGPTSPTALPSPSPSPTPSRGDSNSTEGSNTKGDSPPHYACLLDGPEACPAVNDNNNGKDDDSENDDDSDGNTIANTGGGRKRSRLASSLAESLEGEYLSWEEPARKRMGFYKRGKWYWW